MTDLVDDHGNKTVFGPLVIGSVFFRLGAVEADHGILHSVNRSIYRNGDRVGVVKGEFRVDIEGMNNRVCRIFAPERLTLVGIK